jgi:uncharacterized membrane protein HdeD (DUF308 family)
MTTPQMTNIGNGKGSWLRSYYFTRAAFSLGWLAAAFTVAQGMPGLAAVMLVLYPAWDAAANFVDARRNGGLRSNPTQSLKVLVSLATTVAVVIALSISMNAMLAVFGVWATLSGGLQLGTGFRRWKRHGAQWAMILSGAQSMLAGVFFIGRSQSEVDAQFTDIAPYVAFGAFYFLVSAVWLTASNWRRSSSGGRSIADAS